MAEKKRGLIYGEEDIFDAAGRTRASFDGNAERELGPAWKWIAIGALFAALLVASGGLAVAGTVSIAAVAAGLFIGGTFGALMRTFTDREMHRTMNRTIRSISDGVN